MGESGGTDSGSYERAPAPGYFPSGLVQIQVEVDKAHLNRKISIAQDGATSRAVVAVAAMYNPLDDHILEGELVAQINIESRRPTTGKLGHPALVSNPSGLMPDAGFNHDGLPEHEEAARIANALEHVIPFGVSRVNVGPESQTGFVAQIGGIAQTPQIGEEFTQPGDLVVLGVPTEDEQKRPANIGAPLTKVNWVAKKIQHATPMLALLNATQSGTGNTGLAMLKLIKAIRAAPTRAYHPNEYILGDNAVQGAIREYHAQMANTYQVLRRLELGVVVRGGMRGDPMLIKLW